MPEHKFALFEGGIATSSNLRTASIKVLTCELVLMLADGSCAVLDESTCSRDK